VPEDSAILIEPNKPFCWEKGLCLKTKQRVLVCFPGSLIKEDETIGSIIESNYTTRVEFQSGEKDPTVAMIRIDLAEGSFLKINRRTEAMVTSISERPLHFEILKS
jgi:hypothetical protein